MLRATGAPMESFARFLLAIFVGLLFIRLYEIDSDLCVKGVIAFVIGSLIVSFVRRGK